LKVTRIEFTAFLTRYTITPPTEHEKKVWFPAANAAPLPGVRVTAKHAKYS
jgi:hypothetical protein